MVLKNEGHIALGVVHIVEVVLLVEVHIALGVVHIVEVELLVEVHIAVVEVTMWWSGREKSTWRKGSLGVEKLVY